MTQTKSRLRKIVIEQLAKDGSVFRTFTHYKHDHEIDGFMRRTERAYNMARTRVTIDGKEW